MSDAAPASAGAAQLGRLIGGDCVTGNGGRLISLNPANPEEIVAEGGSTVTADLDRAVRAARASQRTWSKNPIHERGAVLCRAATALESQADLLGLERNPPVRKARPLPREPTKCCVRLRSCTTSLSKATGSRGALRFASVWGTDPYCAQAARRRRNCHAVQLSSRHPGVEDRARPGARELRGVSPRVQIPTCRSAGLSPAT